MRRHASGALQMDDLVATFSTLARVEEMRAARTAKQVCQASAACMFVPPAQPVFSCSSASLAMYSAA